MTRLRISYTRKFVLITRLARSPDVCSLKNELGRVRILIIVADSMEILNFWISLLRNSSCIVPKRRLESETHIKNTAIATRADTLPIATISEKRISFIHGISIPVAVAINAKPMYPITPFLSRFAKIYP